MNIANVIPRFALVSGLDNSGIYKWRPLVEDACSYIENHLIRDDLNDDDKRRLEMLCAVYAFKLYSLCNDEDITSFTAGDVQITSPTDIKSRAESLWQEYAGGAADLIAVADSEDEDNADDADNTGSSGTEGFLFGVIR
ncbi:MAG: hypothetical protein LUF33_06020 [Clostridiales bacterium]|nr:hypothetical protein [Clostridiales bacterium]